VLALRGCHVCIHSLKYEILLLLFTDLGKCGDWGISVDAGNGDWGALGLEGSMAASKPIMVIMVGWLIPPGLAID